MANAKPHEDYLYNQINKLSKENYSNIYDRMMADYSNVNQAAFAQQQQQQQAAENQFYQKLYDTNQTVMDTIRRDNASAIASGASKGAQAAQELAALLQGQTESVGAATELADQQYAQAAEQQATATKNAQQAGTQAGELAANLANAQATAANADAVIHGEEELINKQLSIYSNENKSEAERAAAYAILQAKGFTPEMLDGYTAKANPKSKEAQVRDAEQASASATHVTAKFFNSRTVQLDDGPESFVIKATSKLTTPPGNLSDTDKTRIKNAPDGQVFMVNGTVYLKENTKSGSVYYPLKSNEKGSTRRIKKFLENKNSYYIFNNK